MSNQVKSAAVIGAGAMGGGIAQVLSQAGIRVFLKDINEDFVSRGLANIKKMYDSRVAKEVLTREKADELFANIKGTTRYEDIDKDVDLVIEAASEVIDIKLDIFRTLDKHCGPNTILASNTSALSISQIASVTSRPELVLGIHFFNPAQAMKLVEVIPGVKTDKNVVQDIIDLCATKLGKAPVKVKECPGFLVNRILFPYMNEALYVLQEGKFSPEEIDQKALEFGLPMGPLTLFDLTGIDICAHVVDFLYSEYGPRFKPAELLLVMMEEKVLGQKTGAGFYVHSKDRDKNAAKEVNPKLAELLKKANAKVKDAPVSKADKFEVDRIMMPMFNEVMYALQEDVVAAKDVDTAVAFGLGLKRGILSLAKERGLDTCLLQLEKYQSELGGNTPAAERFRPAWMLKKLVRAEVHDFDSLEEKCDKKEPVAAK
ncbi:MAG: 3-hydroxyacyl-CoA dehydrogenase NAD-binding domain-containing protein [Candidatus Melainabacteria bacterium]|nr:3-hydroxyacyl-CoA dehydrogenase NAD-binding domain-containing protein [Candidatus Melainabacteria bacterium]